jgi:5'-3' exonuclease
MLGVPFAVVKVHLLDGTYELFRHHFGRPPGARRQGETDDVTGTRGVLWSVLTLLEEGVTHLAVATDHVIESFRNDLWPGYKSSVGMDEAIVNQFGLLEDALTALGVKVWAMVELEADDALAAGAVAAAADPEVEQVVVMTPDKDLAQVVSGARVVQLDRRTGAVTDEAGVESKYGVAPESIPDWLALVGDSSDGYPGIPGWGKKAAGAVLRRYRHLEDIPEHPWRWDVDVRGRNALSAALAEHRDLAMLFRILATLRTDAEVLGQVDELRWSSPTDGFADVAARLRAPRLAEKAAALAR